MAYPPLAIANYFIDKALASEDQIDHLRLQKLAYFAHGWNLAVHGTPLFKEAVEAWKYGPVIPSLYHYFKVYGNSPISGYGAEEGAFDISFPLVDSEDQDAVRLLDRVWEVYRPYSGVQLSNLTHRPGTPWHTTFTAGKKKIPNDLIESYFRERASGRRAG